MKKVVSLIAALMLCCNAFAGGFLVKAGLSNSNMDLNQDVGSVISREILGGSFFKNFTGYHIGAGFRTDSWNGFKLQPELLYNVRGTRVDDLTNWKMSYLEMPVNLQWGLDLVILRPFLQVAPCIGYNFSNTTSSTDAGGALGRVTTNANRFEYGISVGGGLDLMNMIQLSLTYNWNFGAVADLSEYQDQVAGIERRNARCLQFSLAYLF